MSWREVLAALVVGLAVGIVVGSASRNGEIREERRRGDFWKAEAASSDTLLANYDALTREILNGYAELLRQRLEAGRTGVSW